MHLSSVGIVVLVVLILFPRGLVSQEAVPEKAEPAHSLATAQLIQPTDSQQASWKSRIMTGLAGAVLGAGIGFFASQVFQGDWDEGGGGQAVNRPTWAALGGAGGFAFGISVPIGRTAPGSKTSLPGDSRFIITGEEIRQASLANAMEAVEFFHPEWLRQQRPDSFEDFRVFTAGEIPVYFDNARLEGINDLAGISASNIRSIRLLTTQQATMRWGTGHRFGAIQVLTVG